MTLTFSFAIPPIRLPILGILGQQALPPQKKVTADFIQLWGIFYANPDNPDVSARVFDVDSFVNMNYDHQQKVSTFPVENGSFVSYNKVNEPRKLKCKLVVHGGQRVATFLEKVEVELMSINLYTIITPEESYHDMTLEKVSYPRDAKSVDQVAVECSFIEVVQVFAQTADAQKIPGSKKPSAVPKVTWAPQPEAPAPLPKAPINPLAGHSTGITWLDKIAF